MEEDNDGDDQYEDDDDDEHSHGELPLEGAGEMSEALPDESRSSSSFFLLFCFSSFSSSCCSDHRCWVEWRPTHRSHRGMDDGWWGWWWWMIMDFLFVLCLDERQEEDEAMCCASWALDRMKTNRSISPRYDGWCSIFSFLICVGLEFPVFSLCLDGGRAEDDEAGRGMCELKLVFAILIDSLRLSFTPLDSQSFIHVSPHPS